MKWAEEMKKKKKNEEGARGAIFELKSVF